jgi:hypothetical protein
MCSFYLLEGACIASSYKLQNGDKKSRRAVGRAPKRLTVLLAASGIGLRSRPDSCLIFRCAKAI